MNSTIRIFPSFCIGLCISLLLLPASWVCAWFLAAAIHELGHYIVLKVLHVPVLQIALCYNGAYIETGYMNRRSEFLSAAAGPLTGMVCVLLFRYSPQLAVCGFIQSAYNLLPFPDYDGGRMLKVILNCFLSSTCSETVYRCFVLVLSIVFVLLGIYLWLFMGLGFMFFLFGAMPVIKSYIVKIPCNGMKQIVQ